MTHHITAVIPTLHYSDTLVQLLQDLTKQRIPVIIVDNEPDEQTALAANKSTYLPQLKNRGFAQAINIAAEHVRTDWLLILNDDIRLKKPTDLTNLLSSAIENNWVATSPILVNTQGDIENMGYLVLPKGKVKLIKSNSNITPDGLTAACLLIKTSIFKKVSGFDPDFFAYLEDIDLFIRLKNRGYIFGVNKQVEVIHQHLTTSKRLGNLKQKMDFKNWIYLIIKNYTISDLIKHFPSICLERLANFNGLLKHTPIFQWPTTIISLTIEIVFHIPKMINKR